MKRRHPFPFLLLLGIVVGTTPAQNGQTVFSSRSEELVPLEALLLSQGLTPPFPVKPYQGIELRNQLGRIDSGRLSEAEWDAFQWVRESFSPSSTHGGVRIPLPPPLQLSIEPTLSLEGYVQSREKPTEWELRDEDRSPLLSFPFHVWGGETFYGYLGLEFRKLPPRFPGEDTVEPTPFSNLPLDIRTLDGNLPFRAFLAAGGSFWGVQFGRDRLSWGNGVTGNFILHDNPLFYNSLRFTLFNEYLKFTTVWASMEHHVVRDLPESKRVERNWLGHRLDVRLSDSFQFALTEAILIAKPTLEMKYLNPLMVYHSWYLDETESNLIASLEATYVPWKGLSFYVQASVNQFTLPIERNRSYARGEPDAYAFLLGTKTARFLERGFVLGGMEGSLTSPWLYIHRTYQTQYYHTQMIMAESVGHRIVVEKPLGYPTGSDTMNLFFYALYRVPASLEWRGDLTLRWRGELSFLDLSEVFIPAAGINPGAYPKNPRTPTGETPEFRAILRVGFTRWLGLAFSRRVSIAMDLYGIYSRNRGAAPGAPSVEAQGVFRFQLEF